MAACRLLAVQPLAREGPGCLPVSLADKASDREQTGCGSRSRCRSDSGGLCRCRPQGSPRILCATVSLPYCGQVGTLERQADTCECKNGTGSSIKEAFPGRPGPHLPHSLGRLTRCPISLGFSIRVGQRHGVGRCVARVQTCWWQVVTRAWENRWAAYPFPPPP